MFREGIYPPIVPARLRRVMYALFWLLSRAKWFWDKRSLPLKERDWTLYLDIHVASFLRLRSFPNFRAPKKLNDQIRWTMLFAQKKVMPDLCDKLAVRDYVQRRIGGNYLVPLIAHGNWEDVSNRLPKGKGVLKCTHDSGSAMFIDCPGPSEMVEIERRFRALLSKKYGVGKGEWPYGLVKPQLVFEELLPGTENGISPPDVKVHCVNGKPAIYEVVVERQLQPRGSLFLPDGKKIRQHIRNDRIPLLDFPIERAIRELERPARRLSAGLLYVRVDFYMVEGSFLFGEMTFFPESGLFSQHKRDEGHQILWIPCDTPQDSIYDSRTAKLL